jgi:hypothetical protein
LLVALAGEVLEVFTVTLNEHEELPQELFAAQVTAVVPAANVLPEEGVQLTAGKGEPVAEGAENVTTGLQVEISEGQAPIAGLSLMVTLNEQLEVPHEFVAVHDTVVVPVVNVEPDAGEQTTDAAGDPVEVGSVHVAMWLSHCTMFEGHAPITGLSLMVTLNEQLEVPQEFVAVHDTVDVPVANAEPDAGEQTTDAAGDPVEVGSVHVAMWLSHCTMFEGHEPIAGLSLMVTLNEQLEVPQEFVAVQDTVVVPVANVEPDAGEQTTDTAGDPVEVGSVHVAMWLSH